MASDDILEAMRTLTCVVHETDVETWPISTMGEACGLLEKAGVDLLDITGDLFGHMIPSRGGRAIFKDARWADTEEEPQG